MTRICLGELDWPDKRGKEQFAQIVFLRAVEALDQAPLRDLYGKPFELYRTAINEFQLDFHAITQPWTVTGAPASLAETLESEIEAWTKRWNLNADWCTAVAYATLHGWSCSSCEITKLVFRHSAIACFFPLAPGPPEGLPEYTPYWGSRDSYLGKIRSHALRAIGENPLLNHAPASNQKAFADSIAAKAKLYCRSIENVYKEAGWIHCRKNEKKNLSQHIEWTVRFQVGGKTFNELAEDANVEQPTVSRAVRDILSILPLPKRPDSKRGRIAGSKNKRPVESAIRRNLGQTAKTK